MRRRRLLRPARFAAGDVMLDASGNVMLDSSGNVMLDDGAGNGCCCGSPPACTGCTSTPRTWTVTISNTLVSAGCHGELQCNPFTDCQTGAARYAVFTGGSINGTFTASSPVAYTDFKICSTDYGGACVWSSGQIMPSPLAASFYSNTHFGTYCDVAHSAEFLESATYMEVLVVQDAISDPPTVMVVVGTSTKQIQVIIGNGSMACAGFTWTGTVQTDPCSCHQLLSSGGAPTIVLS